MIRVLLDSSACIAFMRDRPRGARSLFRGWVPGEAGISSVVLAELEVGVWRSREAAAARRAVDELVANLEVLPFDASAAAVHGAIKARLMDEGKLIGPLDFLIAAHALALGLPLMTGNLGEFKRVPGLKIVPLPKS